MSDEPIPYEDLVRIACSLRGFSNEAIMNLAKIAGSPHGGDAKQLILEVAQLQGQTGNQFAHVAPPPVGNTAESILLGWDCLFGTPITIELSELKYGTAIIGALGTGKSNLAHLLAVEACNRGVFIHAYDFRDEMVRLQNRLSGIICPRLGEMPENLLEAPE